MSLMARVDGARSRLQTANEQLSGARNSRSYHSRGDAIVWSEIGDQINKLTVDVGKGARDRVEDELSSLWDVVTNPIETVKDSWAGVQEAVRNPGQALEEAWNGFKEPYEEDWENGRQGEAIGRGLVEVALLASPTKIFKGLRALGGDGDDAPDVPNNPTPMPEARRGGSVPGLERATYKDSDNAGSAEDQAYEQRVTGNNTGLQPHVWNGERDVKLDGVEVAENGEVTLLEAKNAGENSIYRKNFKDEETLGQASAQAEAARESGATGVKWLVRDQETAEYLQNLFKEEGLAITVTHAP